MKNQFEELAGDTKLQLLRKADPAHAWNSLDDTRHCILCEQIISGRQIQISRGSGGRGVTHLHCPTPGCRSTPGEWVHPENPLLSEEAWRDWVRLLENLCEEPEPVRPKPAPRRFRPRDIVSPPVPKGLPGVLT